MDKASHLKSPYDILVELDNEILQETVVKEVNNDQRMDIRVVENIRRRKKGKGKIPQGFGPIGAVTKDRPEVQGQGSVFVVNSGSKSAMIAHRTFHES